MHIAMSMGSSRSAQVLPIAPSSYRARAAQRSNPELLSDRAREDQRLKPEVMRVFAENFGVYGVRKVWRQMNREGFAVARCTVARLMRDLGLQGVIRGKPVRTTVSNKAAPCPLDHVNRQFHAPAPNMLWVSDFTYGAPRAYMSGMQRRKEELMECLALCCEGA
jgi:transposase InsO family protein